MAAPALAAAGLSGGSAVAAPAVGATAATGANLTPQQALARLIAGNRAVVAGAPPVLPPLRERRREIAQGQAPFAAIVSCSDSRVPPELLLGVGFGDIFPVRVAGNTVSAEGLGSLEYAVAELGVPLIAVLGHERCGAVAAAVSVVKDAAAFPGAIGEMIEPILPAAIVTREEPGDWLDQAVRRNVVNVVERLKVTSTILAEPLAAGKLMIVGGRYDLDEGLVDFFHV